MKHSFGAIIATIFLFMGLLPNANAQDSLFNKPVEELHILKLIVLDGDTLPSVDLDGVTISPGKERTAFEQREYERLKKRIAYVYPYAHRATSLLREIEDITANIDKKRHRKKYLNKLEDELKNDFKQDLKKLSVSQGKVLIKLIERDTDRIFYDILKDLKNPVTAFFFQNLGKKYGYDLKEGYSAEQYEDIEEIMTFLEENGMDFQDLDMQERRIDKLEKFVSAPSVEEVLSKKKKRKKNKK